MSWSGWERVSGDGFAFDEITYEKHHHDELEGGVARVTMNRPQRRNAMTMHMVEEMFRAFYDANHDPAIGVIVLAGAGEHFGSGGDVEWERWGLREACIGGSNHLAYCCDFTIADDTAVFGQAGPRVSSPADGYFVPYLTRVVGAKKAREMWMLCRRYNAQEAERMGLVNKVVPAGQLEAEVDQWCEELLALSPGCLEVLKATFDQELDGFAEMGVISGQLYPDWFDTPEGKEGGAAFTAKRTPRFWPLRKREAQLREQLSQEYERENK
jgi:naphthoate synthase/2-ketocyclohexanecarboxyl-CoA hydrolase